MPWQFGELGLTEDGGNRIIKYADAINHGVSRRTHSTRLRFSHPRQASPNDGKSSQLPVGPVLTIRPRKHHLPESNRSLGHLHVRILALPLLQLSDSSYR